MPESARPRSVMMRHSRSSILPPLESPPVRLRLASSCPNAMEGSVYAREVEMSARNAEVGGARRGANRAPWTQPSPEGEVPSQNGSRGRDAHALRAARPERLAEILHRELGILRERRLASEPEFAPPASRRDASSARGSNGIARSAVPVFAAGCERAPKISEVGCVALFLT